MNQHSTESHQCVSLIGTAASVSSTQVLMCAAVLRVCMYVHIHARAHVHMYGGKHARMYADLHTGTQVHIRMHTFLAYLKPYYKAPVPWPRCTFKPLRPSRAGNHKLPGAQSAQVLLHVLSVPGSMWRPGPCGRKFWPWRLLLACMTASGLRVAGGRWQPASHAFGKCSTLCLCTLRGFPIVHIGKAGTVRPKNTLSFRIFSLSTSLDASRIAAIVALGALPFQNWGHWP